jgi:hypothetical protein
VSLWFQVNVDDPHKPVYFPLLALLAKETTDDAPPPPNGQLPWDVDVLEHGWGFKFYRKEHAALFQMKLP